MIISLRKRHLQSWILIGLILIILIPLAVLSIPDQPVSKSGNIEVSQNSIIESVEEETFTLQLIDGNENYMINVILHEPLKSPAAFLYAMVDGERIAIDRAGAADQYIALIEKKQGKVQSLEVFDDLNDELIFQVNLK